MHARIAQLVEHTTDTGGVLGSNPSARTLSRVRKFDVNPLRRNFCYNLGILIKGL